MMILSLLIGENSTKIALIDSSFDIVSMRESEGTADTPRTIFLCRDMMNGESIGNVDIDYISLAVCTPNSNVAALASEIENTLGIPVRSTSHTAALALGEAYINANDAPSIALLNIGDKIDSAVIIDGKPLLDYTKVDGGLGHTVISYGGYRCSCGRSGCLEAYTSSYGVRRIASDYGITNPNCADISDIFDSADLGDEKAVSAKNAYISRLACGITNIINLFQPHELVIMGALTTLGEKLMNPIMEIVLREQYTRHSPNKCNVRFSAPDSKIALVGAALLWR